MATNDFVPFCNENTGTNLPSQAAYLANPALPIGNQPGIASSSLNNKAIRQASTIASVMAQIATDFTGADMLDNQNTADHAIPPALKGAMVAATKRHLPVLTQHLSGSGTHNLTYKFQVAIANATSGATYSDGTTTFTVTGTIAAATQLVATGPAAPVVSGTLTKLTGSGDATITFYAFRSPLFIKITAVGGGGGGGGMATASTAGGGGGGGGGGGTAIQFVTAPPATLSWAVGALGAGGLAGANDGSNGGDTTVTGTGVSITANGGKGGRGGTATSTTNLYTGTSGQGNAGGASGGDENIPGVPGNFGVALAAGTASSGGGGSSGAGLGSGGKYTAVAGVGNAATGFGGGGSGGVVLSASSSAAGGAGTAGVVIVEEYFQ